MTDQDTESQQPAQPMGVSSSEGLAGPIRRERTTMPDNGGPAFPALHFDMADHEHGMTLRDYFAAKALPAVYGNAEEFTYWCQEYSVDEACNLAADRAYQLADAMLAARKANVVHNPQPTA